MKAKLISIFILFMLVATLFVPVYSAEEEYPLQNVFKTIGKVFSFLKPVFSFIFDGLKALWSVVAGGIDFLVDKFSDAASGDGIPTESDPIWVSDKSNYYTKLQSDARYLQGETDPVWNSQKSGYAQTGTCPSGYAIQNATSSGVQCVAVAGSDTSNFVVNSTLGTTIDTYAYNKSLSDSRYLQSYTEADPIWSSQKTNYYNKTDYYSNATQTFQPVGSYQPSGDYVTGAQVSSNDSTINNTIASIGNWTADKPSYPTSSYLDSNYYNKSLSDSRYLQSFTESDPVWTGVSGNYFTKAQYYDNATQTYTTYFYVENSYFNMTQYYSNATSTFPTYWVLESYYVNTTNLQSNLTLYPTSTYLDTNYYNKSISDGRYLQSVPATYPTSSWVDSNYYNKTLSDGKYQLQTSMGAYQTGTQAVNNDTAINASVAAKALPGNCPAGQVVMNTTTSGVQCITMTGGDTSNFVTNNSLGTTIDAYAYNKSLSDAKYTTWSQVVNGTTFLSATFSTENNSIAHIGSACSAGQFVNQLGKDGPTCATPAGGSSAKTIGYDTHSNISYLVIDGSSMTLTVASLQRITTAPTLNTTNGQIDAYNFPTAGSVGGDGGFVLAGNAGSTGTRTHDIRKMTYFRICGLMNLATNRRDIIGGVYTASNVVMNSTLTGIGFKANTTADGNLYAFVCNAGTCTISSSLGALNRNRNCYEITDNGATWNFWLNGISVANLSNANEPTGLVTWAGWWIESTDATADNAVIEIGSARYEAWR